MRTIRDLFAARYNLIEREDPSVVAVLTDYNERMRVIFHKHPLRKRLQGWRVGTHVLDCLKRHVEWCARTYDDPHWNSDTLWWKKLPVVCDVALPRDGIEPTFSDMGACQQCE
jgi:hypothetical protein